MFKRFYEAVKRTYSTMRSDLREAREFMNSPLTDNKGYIADRTVHEGQRVPRRHKIIEGIFIPDSR